MFSPSTVAVFCIALAFSWILLKLFPVYRKIHTWHVIDDMMIHYPIHWFWGNIPQMETAQKFYDKSIEFVKNGARAYVYWIGFFRPVVVVAHSDSVRTVLRTSEPKSRGGGGYDFLVPWLGEGLLLTSGKRWERNRRMLTPAFHADVLQHYMPIYNQVTETLMAKLEVQCKDGIFVEVSHNVGVATLDVMLQCALSYSDNIQEKVDTHPYVLAVSTMAKLLLRRMLTIYYHVDFIYNLTSDSREMARLVKYVHTFSEKIINARRKALETEPELLNRRYLDFLDILLSARDENGVGLTDMEIRAEVDTFMFEGHDTTASAVSWSLWALALHPDQQERVLQDVLQTIGNKRHVEWDDLGRFQYLPMFIKESMRLYPPVPVVGRELTHPMVIDGAKIPKGVFVDISMYQTHRNPHIWPEPEVFNPERFDPEQCLERDPYSFVPFSAGPRNCIGQNFAMHEIKVMLAKIVRRYKIELDPDRPALLKSEIVLRSENGTHLKFTARKTA